MERLIKSTTAMLIIGLLVVVVAASSTPNQPTIENSEESIRIDSDGIEKLVNSNENENGNEQMSVNDQISVLSRQLKMLTERRQEDYRMLELSLHSYVRKHFEEFMNADIKKELKDLR
jgi:vancomycin resistance protein YoaR